MADLRTSDILAADWARRAREILERNRTPEAREFRKTSIGPRGPRILEDHDLRSPDQVAADIILGRGTGRTVEDILTGLTPLPGAITEARGGDSGILDWIPGAGIAKAGVVAAPMVMKGLKHAGKISEKTINFILRNFDENAVKAIDNYVERFPKVGNIQASDAYKILTEGRAGEMFLPKNISSDEAYAKMLELSNGMDIPSLVEHIAGQVADNGFPELAEDLKAFAPGAQEAVRKAIESGDIMKGLALQESLLNAVKSLDGQYLKDVLHTTSVGGMPQEAQSILDYMGKAAKQNRTYFDLERMDPNIKESGQYINDYVLMQTGVAQDLESIEAKQLKSEANRAQKEARKAQKAAAKENATARQEQAIQSVETAQAADNEAKLAKAEADRARYMKNLEKRAEENRELTQSQQSAAAEREIANVANEAGTSERILSGGPGKWKENGWTPEGHPITEPGMSYYELGKDATPEDKRALYVLDSLAAHHAANLIRNEQFKGDWPGREVVRHRGTNYDTKSFDFGRDVAWNMRTGNLPTNTSSIILKDAVSTAGHRLPGQKTGILNGKDLYDLLFRKKADRKINELDSRYNVDFLGF